MANASLAAIRTKIRRLTRSPSTAQIADADIDEYVNTFIAYDFPEQLRQFSLRTTVTFYCQPYLDIYVTDKTLPPTNPLYDFKNIYLSVHPPVYIAGFGALFSQSREQFFALYPFVSSLVTLAIGNGIFAGPYAGTLSNKPVMRNNVVFTSTDVASNGLVLHDVPTALATGNLVDPATGIVWGVINYVTGVYTFTFPVAPGIGKQISAQTAPYSPSLPQALLYYNDQFIVRPIPDKPYSINFEAYIRPTQLLAAGSVPDIEQWWQYIAFGAALKLLEDRLDFDTMAQLMPLFKEQEKLVIRRTLVQNSTRRTSTIYTEQVNMGPGAYGFGYGGGLF